MLEDEYFRSGYDIKAMLRALFHSDAFKNARFSRIKGPIETVIGTLRLVGDWDTPKPGFEIIFDEMKHMGQEILNPPSVEGWHTGKEWIDGGTLVRRINFIADYVGDLTQPGIQDIVRKLQAQGPVVSPTGLVDGCLRLLGCYELEAETREMLVKHAEKSGDLPTGDRDFPRPGNPDAANDCGYQGVSLRLTGAFGWHRPPGARNPTPRGVKPKGI